MNELNNKINENYITLSICERRQRREGCNSLCKEDLILWSIIEEYTQRKEGTVLILNTKIKMDIMK